MCGWHRIRSGSAVCLMLISQWFWKSWESEMEKIYTTYLLILIALIDFFPSKLFLNKMLILEVVEENYRGFIEK